MDQAALLALAGMLLGVFISILKTVYKTVTGAEFEGAFAYWLTFCLSLIISVVILSVKGGLEAPPVTPLEFIAWFGVAFATVAGAASTIYKVVISEESGLGGVIKRTLK